MSTLPPVKSPGWSGVKVFVVLIPSKVGPGKRSTLIARLSGSEDGNLPPFISVLTYRSDKPRTTTYFPSTTEVPTIRFKASPAVEAPSLEMRSAPMLSRTAVAPCLSARRPVSDAFSNSPGTTNSSISSTSAIVSTRMSLNSPLATATSGMTLAT